jgi:hypothetical protein
MALFVLDYVRKRNQRVLEHRLQKLKHLDVGNLTLMQKELLHVRAKLLKFMDRLNLYEQILSGPIKAHDLIDIEKYSQMRSKPILRISKM